MADPANAGRAENILVFRVGQLGDSLVALPAIAEIRRRHPGARMVLLTEQQSSSDRVSAWDVYGPTGWFDDVAFYRVAFNLWQRLMTTISLVWRLRREKYHVVYDLAPQRTPKQDSRDRFFFRHLIGIPDYRGGGCFSRPSKEPGGRLPRMEPEWRRLLRAAAANDDAVISLPMPQGDQDVARSLLAGFGIDKNDLLIALGLGSKMPAKRWPLERYKEVGKRLLAKYPTAHLVVVGGTEDVALGDELCRACGDRSHNAAGRLSPYGSAALLRSCAAYVGNDTGAMHLAGMVGTPCVALFSARDYPGQWEPYGSGHAILRHEVDCAGCMLEVCPYENKCLSLIETNDVIAHAELLLGKRVASETKS